MLSATEVTAPTSISPGPGSGGLGLKSNIIIFSIVAVFVILAIVFVVYMVKKRRAEYIKDDEAVSSSLDPFRSTISPPWESHSGLARMEIPESYMPEMTKNIEIRSTSRFRAEYHPLEESEFLMRNEPEDSSNF
ncbi:hypothetical protein GQ53DRAFT_845591 [Thozetella sp. PMI_491]|nr:hypothetical protein GQ53DRAFT_845591 [Thozetella sp. PMI_491]